MNKTKICNIILIAIIVLCIITLFVLYIQPQTHEQKSSYRDSCYDSNAKFKTICFLVEGKTISIKEYADKQNKQPSDIITTIDVRNNIIKNGHTLLNVNDFGGFEDTISYPYNFFCFYDNKNNPTFPQFETIEDNRYIVKIINNNLLLIKHKNGDAEILYHKPE